MWNFTRQTLYAFLLYSEAEKINTSRVLLLLLLISIAAAATTTTTTTTTTTYDLPPTTTHHSPPTTHPTTHHHRFLRMCNGFSRKSMRFNGKSDSVMKQEIYI